MKIEATPFVPVRWVLQHIIGLTDQEVEEVNRRKDEDGPSPSSH